MLCALESLILGKATISTATKIYGIPWADLDRAWTHSRRSQTEFNILRTAARFDLWCIEWGSFFTLPPNLNLDKLLELWNESEEKQTGVNPMTQLANSPLEA
jgi:hypothetical protein